MSARARVRFTVVVFGVAAVLAASTAAAQSRPFPTSGVDPTWADCHALDREYYAILAANSAKMSACMKQPPRFGMARSCKGGQTYTAWTQCDAIELARCAANDAKDREVGKCRALASARQQRDSDDREREAALQRANDQTARAMDMIRLVRDPAAYFREVFNPDPHGALRRIFPKPNSLDRGLARELYRYATTFTEEATSAHPNPTIGAIQGAALKHLQLYHRRFFAELDEVERAIRDAGREDTARPAARAPATTARSGVPGALVPGAPESADCRYAAGLRPEYLDQCARHDGCSHRSSMEAAAAGMCK